MIRFDQGVSTTQLVDFGNFSTPTGLSTLTVCAFIEYVPGDGDTTGRIIGQDNGGAAIAFGLLLRDSPTDATKRELLFVLQTGAGNDLTLLASVDQLSPNTLYHVAGVYDGSEMRLYVDAREVASVAKTGNVSLEPTWNLLIGNAPAGNRSFEGLIGDGRIYNRVLSPEELFAIKETFGQENIDNGLLFHAPLDGPDGETISGAETVLDEVGGEFTAQNGGTAQNGPTYEDMPIPVDEVPASLNNVFAWLDGSDESTMSFDNATEIAEWRDKIANVRTASGGTAPEIDQTTVNGLSTVTFGGPAGIFADAQHLNAGFLSGTAGLVGKKYTIFIVETKASTSGDSWIFGGSSTTANQNLHIGYRASNQFSLSQWNNDLDVTNAAYDAAGVTRLHTLINGASGKFVRLNGSQVGSSTNTTNLASYPGPEIGRRATNGAFTVDLAYDGSVSEIIIFDREVSPDELQLIESYLIKKWGL